MKRQPTKWENIFANDTSHKGLIPKIHKELIKLNTKQPPKSNSIKKWTKDPNRYFSKDDIQLANRHMKRWSMSLITREMQIKATIRYHLTFVRIVIISKSTKKCWWQCGEKGTLVDSWWQCKLVQPRTMESSIQLPQNIKNWTTLWPSNSISRNVFKETQNIYSKEYMHPYVHCGIVYNS